MNASRTGLVIASYGKRGLADTGTGAPERFMVKGRRLRVVCGDRIALESQQSGSELLATDVLERKNLLERPDTRGGSDALAANLDYLIVVVAPEPAPDFYIADRYLAAAELMDAAALIVWNKTDLGADRPEELDDYIQIGYPVVATSAESADGTAPLIEALQQGVGILTGQSGVGKSSLINRLIPDSDVATGALSEASREGRHTTTASALHTLPGGAQLIDSPGVREFAPVIPDLAIVQAGFREIHAAAADCRFANCQHMREPDCAVKAAVDAGSISARRYESYKRLRHSAAALERKN